MDNKAETTDIFDQTIREFLKVASKYFHFLENVENYETRNIVEFLYTISPLLYTKGALFPETEMPDDSANERFVTEEEWETVFQALRLKFGKLDKITFINYEDVEKNVVNGSLAELFADVYQDLKDFAHLLSKPTLLAQINAIYEVKKLYKTHWGPRLLISQQVLHSFLFKKII